MIKVCGSWTWGTRHRLLFLQAAGGRVSPRAGKGFGPVTKPKPPKKPKRQSLLNGPTRKDRISANDFERLMLDWDDIFAHLCEDAGTAREIQKVAFEGHGAQGPGLVYVTVVASKKSAKTATSTAGSVPLVGESGLVLDSWRARYVSASRLRDGNVGGLHVGPEGVSLPRAASLVGHAAGGDKQGVGSVEEGTVIDELRSIMRGVDNTRLLSLVGCSPDVGESNEQAYEPSVGELVMLLHAKVDGVPATGADVVRCRVRDGGDSAVELFLPALEGL